MRTGSHLKIQSMGDNVLGVRLEGNKAKPEPDYFRVVFPGGDVDITRTSDGQYWVHVRVNNESPSNPNFNPLEDSGRISNARLDVHGKSISETDAGDFANPDLYHVAVLVERTS